MAAPTPSRDDTPDPSGRTVAETGAMSPGDEAPPGTPGTAPNVCRACGGSGQLDGGACRECDGTGQVTVGVGGA